MPQFAIAPVMALMVLLATDANAQWLKYPTPGIPRLPDGQANLSAQVPRTAEGKPDLTGTWIRTDIADLFDLARNLTRGELLMTPWAAAIQAQRESRDHVDDPYGYCLPLGTPRINFSVGGSRSSRRPQ
jgi:hypothetical protein